jgi:hypothetical protein
MSSSLCLFATFHLPPSTATVSSRTASRTMIAVTGRPRYDVNVKTARAKLPPVRPASLAALTRQKIAARRALWKLPPREAQRQVDRILQPKLWRLRRPPFWTEDLA